MSKDKLIELSKEDELAVIEQLKDHMAQEYHLELGGLQAKMLLDFMVDTIGPKLYNQVVDDMEPWFYARFTAILEDMYALKKD